MRQDNGHTWVEAARAARQTKSCQYGRLGRVHRSLAGIILALGVGVLFQGTALHGAAPPAPPKKAPSSRAEYLPEPSAAEKKVLAALDRTISVNWEAKPLDQAVTDLKEKTGVNIVIAQTDLYDWAVEADTPVTVQLEDVRLRAALGVILTPLELTYIVQNDVLQIIPVEKELEVAIVRTYPVGDLCSNAEDLKSLLSALRVAAYSEDWKTMGLFADDLDDGKGGVAIERPMSLVIRQTHSGHGRILQLLRSLRHAQELAERVDRKVRSLQSVESDASVAPE